MKLYNTRRNKDLTSYSHSESKSILNKSLMRLAYKVNEKRKSIKQYSHFNHQVKNKRLTEDQVREIREDVKFFGIAFAVKKWGFKKEYIERVNNGILYCNVI